MLRLTMVFTLVLTLSGIGHAAPPVFGELLSRTHLNGGVCAVPQCGDGAAAIAIARASKLLVHAFDSSRERVDRAVSKVTSAGLWGDRIVVERLDAMTLPYADRFVDLVVLSQHCNVDATEVNRVVRPRGFALLEGQTALRAALSQAGFESVGTAGDCVLMRKPELVGADDWSHWAHLPDNNPVSTDAAVHAPYLTQWFAKPYFHSMPVVSTTAAGRIFIATGHIAHHDREIATLNSLLARNAYNGQTLWRRQLPEGYLVHRSAFVATTDAFFMMDGNGILKMDPETGEVLERLEIPGLSGTLMWMAKVGNMMYVLAGEGDPPATTFKVHASFRGWGWNNVDRNYSPKGKHQIRWGFGTQVAAFDLVNKKVRWQHHGVRIDSRAMAILGDRLFCYQPGTVLSCLDRHTGHLLWRTADREKLSLIEQEANGLPGTPGFRTEPILLATSRGLFIQGQKRLNVTAFAVDTGQFLWSRRKYHNNPNMLFTDGRLYISGIGRNGAVQEINPLTGASIDNLNFVKGSCTRMTASPEALYCRGEGFGRFDLKQRIYTAERSARPGCNDGVIAANGMLYVGPWLCDCNLSILGQMALAPANGWNAQSQTVRQNALERVPHELPTEFLDADQSDWPTYRGDNGRAAATAATISTGTALRWQLPTATSHAQQTAPIAVGDRVYIAAEDGVVRGVSTRDGMPQWRFVTGGPIIAAPTFWHGRVLVGSGDGYIYCLNAEDGGLLWRFRVAPRERRIMVYGHLASTWPVNSGVLVHDGIAYAAAGIVFRDGTHVVALDAATGRLKWHNGTTGKPLNDRYELRAASALGTLVLGRGKLWLAAGNVVAPVAFDLESGQAVITEAHRVPVWNTVMAQKPEPAGRELMVFEDQLLIHGGRVLYCDEGQEVSPAQFSYRVLGDDGLLVGPAVTPTRHSVVTPAYDEDIFVTPTSRYGDLAVWPTGAVVQQLAKVLKFMVEQDKSIPGDKPEKWGEYNRIGKVFAAAERTMRQSSLWPASTDQLYSIAVARNAVVLVGHRRAKPAGYFVWARQKADGHVMWSVELPSEPTLGGIAISRYGDVLVSQRDGRVSCLGVER